MKIDRATITNVKSYADSTTIRFRDGLNLLIGPNSGGKSNLFEIVGVTLRRHLLTLWELNEPTGADAGRPSSITRVDAFYRLPTHHGKPSETASVRLRLRVEATDLANIAAIAQHQEALTEKLRQLTNTPAIPEFTETDLSTLKGVTEVEYEVVQDKLITPNAAGATFAKYLSYFGAISILADQIDSLKLARPFQIFSSHRGLQGGDTLRAHLAAKSFRRTLAESERTSTASFTTFDSLACTRLAQRFRTLEATAGMRNPSEDFERLPEVTILRRYLREIGYDFSLNLISATHNVYELAILRAGKQFALSEASSGEREILNFLLGLAAFGVEDGVVMVDEPELHLHPKWQNLLLRLLQDVSAALRNQLIISTHSSVFITPETVESAIRVSLRNGESVITHCDATRLATPVLTKRNLLRVVSSQNNEKVFFADLVVFVEGIIDKIVLSELLRLATVNRNGEVAVIDVGGKGNFPSYIAIAEAFGIDYAVVADRDYLKEVGGAACRRLFSLNAKNAGKVLKDFDPASKDAAQFFEELGKAIAASDLKVLGDVYTYMRERHADFLSTLDTDEELTLTSELALLAQRRVFVLRRGAIEAYLPSGCGSKDVNKAIALTASADFLDRLEQAPATVATRQELLEIVTAVVGRLPLKKAQL